jgi:hypothetical protein
MRVLRLWVILPAQAPLKLVMKSLTATPDSVSDDVLYP